MITANFLKIISDCTQLLYTRLQFCILVLELYRFSIVVCNTHFNSVARNTCTKFYRDISISTQVIYCTDRKSLEIQLFLSSCLKDLDYIDAVLETNQTSSCK